MPMTVRHTVGSDFRLLLRYGRLFLAGVVLVPFVPFLAMAQVKISLPSRQYAVSDQIHAKAENMGKRPITICVDIGRTSMNKQQQESTPSPFWAEKRESGKWGVVLAPDDIGFFEIPQVIDPGESLDFPFRLLDTGTLRLRLLYWRGDLPKLDCNKSPKRSRIAASPPFVQKNDDGTGGNAHAVVDEKHGRANSPRNPN